MFLSVFDIFKLGVGPSSSHTMGPMTAAARFLDQLRVAGGVQLDVAPDPTKSLSAATGGPNAAPPPARDAVLLWSAAPSARQRRLAPEPGARRPTRLECRLHGSLAFTGKGHATDRAVALGLLGFRPATLDPDAADAALTALAASKTVRPEGLGDMRFDPDLDLIFDYGPPLSGHANGLRLAAYDADGNLYLEETFYSVGGGFVVTEAELAGPTPEPSVASPPPHPFANAKEMLEMGAASGLSIAQMKRANETAADPEQDLDAGLDAIWSTMTKCIDRGLRERGVLPGGLKVRRRAADLFDQLSAESGRNDAPPHIVNDWISLYAMAVNEENAAGGRVVTAPTNGAAGVVPAAMRYYLDHAPGARPDKVRDFLLVASAIGGLIKANASISGAEVGCQGEVGSASAMAAAGLAAILGGTNEQVENAAEIALEHHLGMTCDPAGGLVQVPCIERNGLGAVKAVTAASLALRGDGAHFMPLDNCVEAMRQTGLEMSAKFKETSQGGLAVNLPEC